MTPAAAGIGMPLNGLPFSAGEACAPWSASEEAAMQLKRASRNAPHARYRNAIRSPGRGNS